jgi:hypothetical protein
MATASASSWTGARWRVGGWSMREFLLRCLLAAVGVAICYQFRWDWLRYLTSELNLRFDAVLGVHWQRLTFDTALWNGRLYTYLIACTMADAWCGALGFLWSTRQSMAANLLTLAEFTICLFALNITRLSLSDFLCAHGAPWALGHDVVAGICYFLIWEWLVWHGRRTSAACSFAR